MTTEEIKQWLKEYSEEQGYESFEDRDFQEILQESGKTVFTGDIDEHRWYYQFERVVKIKDKYFSFIDASNTGDMSMREIGWEFDWKQVREVKPVEKTVTVYE